MKIYYTDEFVLPLPPKHRFPMTKYAELRRRISANRLVPPESLAIPAGATDRQLRLVHTADYLSRVKTGQLTKQEVRQIGFPWSPELVERSRRSVGATISAARTALSGDHGWISVNLAGGTHHAFHHQGQGYCVFNDSAVAARVMQAEGRVRRLLIVDCDVHQGNGTAVILAQDSAIFTFSIHGAKNFPFRKEVSDLDIALEDGADDSRYLSALQAGLEEAFTRSQPELVIYLAGADPYHGDRLGRLALSKAGLAERDRLVLTRCHADQLPVAIAMAGGYAPDVNDIVDIHYQTVAIAAGMSG